MSKLDGIILKGIGGFYYVEAAGEIYECKARGVFRKSGIKPLAGDRVQISVNDNAEILEELFRGLVKLKVKPHYLFYRGLPLLMLTDCLLFHQFVSRSRFF